MENHVYDTVVKCEEMLHLWEMKMAKLEYHFIFNSRKEHPKMKIGSCRKCRMQIGTSETFMNGRNTPKMVFSVGELEHLNQRLNLLEEEMESMKQAIFWHVKERRRLVNKIYHYFLCIQHMLWQPSEVKREQFCHHKLIKNHPKDGRVLAGLPEVLCPDFNSSLITKGLQATIYFPRNCKPIPHIHDSSI